MNKLFFALTFLLLVAISGIANTSSNFETLTADGCNGPTRPIVAGDTIEKLFGRMWRFSAIPLNPGISERILQNKKGETIVLLYPSRGDTLCMPQPFVEVPIASLEYASSTSWYARDLAGINKQLRQETWDMMSMVFGFHLIALFILPSIHKHVKSISIFRVG